MADDGVADHYQVLEELGRKSAIMPAYLPAVVSDQTSRR